jgi:hypothetical protein
MRIQIWNLGNYLSGPGCPSVIVFAPSRRLIAQAGLGEGTSRWIQIKSAEWTCPRCYRYISPRQIPGEGEEDCPDKDFSREGIMCDLLDWGSYSA